MKIAIIGAGAIGSVLGGLLARAGRDVTLIGWQPHVSAIKRKRRGGTRTTNEPSPHLPQASLALRRLAQRCQPPLATLSLPPISCDGFVSLQSTFVLSW
jgi:ketopantoate reductase